MKPFLFAIFSFLGFFCVSAQDSDSVLLKGKILSDSIVEASVHIVNLNQKTGTVNSENGNFEIEVFQNDTLLFSSVQFESEEIVVNLEIFDNPQLEVKLVPIALEEIKISNISLSGDLEKDIEDIEIQEPIDFGLPKRTKPKLTASERKIYTASTGPVDVLVNVLSGRLKMLKRHDANMKRKTLVDKAKNTLPNKFFVEDLDLNQDEIINFLHFCAETDPQFQKHIKKNAPLQLIEYFKAQLPACIQEKEGEKRE